MYKITHFSLRAILIFSSSIISSQAFSQTDETTAAIPSKVHSIDSSNVNVTSGSFTYSNVDMSIGSREAPYQINLIRTMIPTSEPHNDFNRSPLGTGYTHNFHIFSSCSYCVVGAEESVNTVVVGDQGYSFLVSGTADSYSGGGEGAVLNSSGFRTKDGVQITFGGDLCNYWFNNSQGSVGYGRFFVCSFANKITFPTGEVIKFEYETAQTSGVNTFKRLKYAYNPDGYGLRFRYLDNSTDYQTMKAGRYRVVKVEAFDASCGSPISVCSQNVLQSAEYGYAQSALAENHDLVSIKKPDGAIITTGWNADSSVYSISVPNNSTQKIASVTYSNFSSIDPGMASTKLVSSFKDGAGNITSYNYVKTGNDYIVTVSHPSSGTETYYHLVNMAPVRDGLRPVRYKDELGRNTYFEYSLDLGKVTKKTNPDGDFVNYTYNGTSSPVVEDRGILTEVRAFPKPGTGMPQIVETLSYPSSCDAVNFRICNKPSYGIDARGNRTDYQYGLAHGQLTSVIGPAASDGVKPETSFGYTAYTGADGNTFYLKSSMTEKISTGVSVSTSYEYDPAANYALKSIVRTSGGQSLRACYRYDNLGRMISETQPAANLTSCP